MSTPQLAPIPAVDWFGASGTKYVHWIFKLPISFEPNQLGNYIFAKVVNNTWIPVYVGQGDLSLRCKDEDHCRCAIARGATHLHAHRSPNESTRLTEERDILASHPVAYGPTGCNQKLGG